MLRAYLTHTHTRNTHSVTVPCHPHKYTCTQADELTDSTRGRRCTDTGAHTQAHRHRRKCRFASAVAVAQAQTQVGLKWVQERKRKTQTQGARQSLSSQRAQHRAE